MTKPAAQSTANPEPPAVGQESPDIVLTEGQRAFALALGKALATAWSALQDEAVPTLPPTTE